MSVTTVKRMLGAVTVAATLAAFNAVPATAQDRAVNVNVRAGGFNGLTDLEEGGTADFHTTGYSLGAGLGVDLTRHLALRGDFTYARNELRLEESPTGDEMDRYFYEAAVQLMWPMQNGVTPYLFAGGGAITVSETGTDDATSTTPTGTLGLGLSYMLPNTGLGLFVEGRSWLFNADELSTLYAPYERNQFDLAWTGGVSYRLPF